MNEEMFNVQGKVPINKSTYQLINFVLRPRRFSAVTRRFNLGIFLLEKNDVRLRLLTLYRTQ